MRCPSCGKKNLAGFVYCQKCGSELTAPPTAAGSFDPSPEEFNAAPQPDSDDAEEFLVLLLEQGKKLEAIKLYRERTGAGLAEAKRAIERLRRQEAIESGDLEPRLTELLRRGEKIAAIKLYRTETGAALAEAKAAIDHVAAKHGLETKRSGCFTTVALAAILSGGVLWWL